MLLKCLKSLPKKPAKTAFSNCLKSAQKIPKWPPKMLKICPKSHNKVSTVESNLKVPKKSPKSPPQKNLESPQKCLKSPRKYLKSPLKVPQLSPKKC